jgi:nucleoside-diphosphate-sugar epimerase
MIVVAGGTGFVGSAAVRRLAAAGVDVAVMTAHPERSQERIERLGARMVRGDIQDAASLPAAVWGADAVVQALTFPTFPVEKPRKGYTFEEFDHRGTERLVRAAAEAGVKRYVYVSGALPPPRLDRTWHRAKRGGEESVRTSEIPYVILRPSWAYGPGDRALNRFVAFHRWLPFVPVVGDGEQRLQPVFIDDVGEVLAQAALGGDPTGTFEIGGPEVMSMNDVLRTMMDVRGKRKPLVHFPPWMPKLAGAFLQFLPKPLLSPDAVEFVLGDALADTRELLSAFDVRLTPLREGLATYLGPSK